MASRLASVTSEEMTQINFLWCLLSHCFSMLIIQIKAPFMQRVYAAAKMSLECRQTVSRTRPSIAAYMKLAGSTVFVCFKIICAYLTMKNNLCLFDEAFQNTDE